MGSFTEVSLSFDFAPATPDHVLAAFSALTVPADGAPPIPEPVGEREVPDEDIEDLCEDDPWDHDWAPWITLAQGIQTTPHGLLTWSGTGRWNLDCRFSWKTEPEQVSELLEWLAPYVDLTFTERRLVGYAHHEYASRPCLFWVKDGDWVPEDLGDIIDG